MQQEPKQNAKDESSLDVYRKMLVDLFEMGQVKIVSLPGCCGCKSFLRFHLMIVVARKKETNKQTNKQLML